KGRRVLSFRPPTARWGRSRGEAQLRSRRPRLTDAHRRSASRASRIADASRRVPVASTRARARAMTSSSVGVSAVFTSTPRKYSCSDLPDRAARAASSSRTWSGTSRTVMATMTAYYLQCRHYACSPSGRFAARELTEYVQQLGLAAANFAKRRIVEQSNHVCVSRHVDARLAQPAEQIGQHRQNAFEITLRPPLAVFLGRVLPANAHCVAVVEALAEHAG